MKTLQTERNATHTLQSVSVLLIIRVEGEVPVCEWVIYFILRHDGYFTGVTVMVKKGMDKSSVLL